MIERNNRTTYFRYYKIYPGKARTKVKRSLVVVLNFVMRAFQNKKKYFIPESFRDVNNKIIIPVRENILVTKCPVIKKIP